jgi:hypothetical protein
MTTRRFDGLSCLDSGDLLKEPREPAIETELRLNAHDLAVSILVILLLMTLLASPRLLLSSTYCGKDLVFEDVKLFS